MSDEIPKPSAGDILHGLAKAGMSAVPVVGGPGAELFHMLIQPPLERRRIKWMEDVGRRLIVLEEKGLRLEDLQDNPRFITAVVQASTAAIRTHNEAKLAALRNAVLNIGQGQVPSETLQHMLLAFVDELTEMHLCVLAFANSPEPPSSRSAGSLSHALEERIPNLHGHREIYDQLWRDLYNRGLVGIDSLHSTMSEQGLRAKRTTALGEALLKLIAEVPESAG